jgi:hypothetical protein
MHSTMGVRIVTDDANRGLRAWAGVAAAGGTLVVLSLFLQWRMIGGINGYVSTGLEFPRWGPICLILGVVTVMTALAAAMVSPRSRAIWLSLVTLGVTGIVITVWVWINVTEAMAFNPATDGHIEILGRFFNPGHVGNGLMIAIAGSLLALVGAMGGYRRLRHIKAHAG